MDIQKAQERYRVDRARRVHQLNNLHKLQSVTQDLINDKDVPFSIAEYEMITPDFGESCQICNEHSNPMYKGFGYDRLCLICMDQLERISETINEY